MNDPADLPDSPAASAKPQQVGAEGAGRSSLDARWDVALARVATEFAFFGAEAAGPTPGTSPTVSQAGAPTIADPFDPANTPGTSPTVSQAGAPTIADPFDPANTPGARRRAASEAEKAAAAAIRAEARAKAKAERAASRAELIPPRRRYAIGELRYMALKRGREIVERWGVHALTLRGLARDLGVSAPALLYYFGSRDGLRAAIAEGVQAELAQLTERPRASQLREDLGETGERWIAFAEQNANLYRLAFGEGWRVPGQGWRASRLPLPLPTHGLEFKVRRGIGFITMPAPVPPENLEALAHHVTVSIHGLAMARADGARPWLVREALTLLLNSVPAGTATATR